MIGKVIVKEPTPIGDGRYAWTHHMRDDGKWYAEVIDTEDGNVVHTTKDYVLIMRCSIGVKIWAKKKKLIPQNA